MIFSTESGLFSENVSKVFFITSAMNEKNDSVGMVISSVLCLTLPLCCTLPSWAVGDFPSVMVMGFRWAFGVGTRDYWDNGDVGKQEIQRNK